MKRPNIVLICIDCGRKDRMSCYGYKKPTTPNIDALAKKGTIFTNFHSASTWTLPSYTSMFTGLYPEKHGVLRTNRKLNENIKTLKHFLSKNNYFSMSLSNNKLSGNGQFEMFDEDINIDEYEKSQYYISDNLFKRAAANPFRYFKLLPFWIMKKMFLRDLFANKVPYLSMLSEFLMGIRTNQDKKITELIKINLPKLKQKTPFFLSINFLGTHAPRWPAQKFRKRFCKTSTISNLSSFLKVPLAVNHGVKSLTKKDEIVINEIYDAAIAQVDHYIGQTVKAIKSSGFENNTIFIILADHGESLGEHNRLAHGHFPFKHLIEIPLVIFPRIGNKKEIDSLASNIDLFPTILGFIGEKNISKTDGKNLFSGKSKFIFSQVESRMLASKVKYRIKNKETVGVAFPDKIKFSALIDDKNKYVISSKGKELFLDRLDKSIELDDKKKRFYKKCMSNLLKKQESFPLKAKEYNLNEEVRQKLKEMGYF